MDMRAAIYARVSSKEQDDAIQLAEIEEYVKRWKWQPSIYSDKISGKAGLERPGLNRLLADARAKKIDVVVVYKLDRFGRSVREVLNNIEILDQCGVRFIVPGQGLDTDKSSAISRFLLHVLGCVAELERSFISDRTTAGYEAYRAAYRAGGIGVGRKHSKSGKDLGVGRPQRVFRRDQAVLLRKRGMSFRDIAAKLKVPRTTVRRALAHLKDAA